jgi:hypothetical protein
MTQLGFASAFRRGAAVGGFQFVCGTCPTQGGQQFDQYVHHRLCRTGLVHRCRRQQAGLEMPCSERFLVV